MFQCIEQSARVAVGIADDALFSSLGEFQFRHGDLARTLEQLLQFLRRQCMQHINLRARQQRVVHFERRILGGRADEGHQTLFDVRQKGILLRLVEAMNLIHEQDGVAAMLLQHQLRLCDRFADVLDAG